MNGRGVDADVDVAISVHGASNKNRILFSTICYQEQEVLQKREKNGFLITGASTQS